MAVTNGFFNAVEIAPGVYDREYDANQMSSLFDGIIRDGIFQSIGSRLMISAGEGFTVNVGTGRAWFDSTWTLNDALLPITLDPSEILQDRIDLIVLDVNTSIGVRNTDFIVVKGVPSSTPQAPIPIESLSHNQYVLAEIRIRRGSVVITQEDITNRIGQGRTPFVTGILEVLNIDDLVAQWGNEWRNFFDARSAEMIAAAENQLSWFEQISSSTEATVSGWVQGFNTTITNLITTFQNDTSDAYNNYIMHVNTMTESVRDRRLQFINEMDTLRNDVNIAFSDFWPQFRIDATQQLSDLLLTLHDMLDGNQAIDLAAAILKHENARVFSEEGVHGHRYWDDMYWIDLAVPPATGQWVPTGEVVGVGITWDQFNRMDWTWNQFNMLSITWEEFNRLRGIE